MKRLVCMVVVCVVLGLFSTVEATATKMNNDVVDIKTFVTQKYELGISCENAGRYGEESVPVLIEMLEDAAYESYWGNIVTTLGCIGSPAAVEPLHDFLKRHQGKVSFDTFSALLSVPTALGFISFNGDEQALEILAGLAKEDYWRQANVKVLGDLPIQDSVVEKSLVRSTIGALGYSGTEQAKVILETIKENPKLNKAYQADIDFAIAQ